MAKLERPGNGEEEKVEEGQLSCRIQCLTYTFDFAMECIEVLRNGKRQPFNTTQGWNSFLC